MMNEREISGKTKTLRKQFEAKLGVKSTTLAQALRRAGRRLPRKLRNQGVVLLDAEYRVGNPKLARQINESEVGTAYQALSKHLRGIDAADQRKGRILGYAGAVAGNLLVVMVAFIVWLWWRGYV